MKKSNDGNPRRRASLLAAILSAAMLMTMAFAAPATAQDVWLQNHFGPSSVPRDTGTVSYSLLINNNSATIMPSNTILVKAEAVQVNPDAVVKITMCGIETDNEASCFLTSNLTAGASWHFGGITLEAPPGSIFPTAIEVTFSVSRAGDPNPLNDSISITVPFNRSMTDLATALDPATRTVTLGDTVGYTLTTTAQGESTVGVTATVETPPGVTLGSVSDSDCTIESGDWNGLSCDLGSAPSRSITFNATFTEVGPDVTLISGIGSGSNSDPDGTNNQASSVVTVERRSQGITFGGAPAVAVGASGNVSATGGASGNPVVFTSQTIATCTVSGAHGEMVTGVSAGECTIAANQAGNDEYAAAPEVTQSFDIAVATATVTVASNLDPANVGDSVMLTATVNGQAPTGTVSFSADGIGIDGCSAQALSGNAPATATCSSDQLAAGTRAITASYSGDDNNAAATSDALTQTINAFPTIDAPTSQSMPEDAQATIDITLGDAETQADQLQLSVTSSDQTLVSDAALAAGLGGTGSNRMLVIDPSADAFGVATLTLTVTDGNGAATSVPLSLTVTPVNDAPQANYGTDRLHPTGTQGIISVSGFATGINPGPDEAGQSVDFETIVVRQTSGLDPATGDVVDLIGDVSLDADGTLRYTLSGISGAAEIDITPVDDGGTADGGNDRGAPHTLRIVVGDGIDLIVDLRRVTPAAPDDSGLSFFEILVTNNGPVDAVGGRVAFTRQIALLDVSWSCTAPGQCQPVSGSGPVDARFDLAAGQTLVIELGGTVDESLPFLELRAQVFAPPGMSALFTEDDSAEVIEAAGPSGVFKAGFER